MEVVPYLIRRAQENSSVLSGATLELKLLREEMVARVLGPAMENVRLCCVGNPLCVFLGSDLNTFSILHLKPTNTTACSDRDDLRDVWRLP